MIIIRRNKAHRGHTSIKALCMVTLILLTLVAIVGAEPYAFVANCVDTRVSVFDIDKSPLTIDFVGAYVMFSSCIPYGVAVNPNGKIAYVTTDNSMLNICNIKDLGTGPGNFRSVIVGNNPRGVAVSLDGKKVYVANFNDNTVNVIDTVTFGSKLLKAGNNPTGVAVSPDGKYLYVTNYIDNTVTAVNTTTNKIIASIKVGDGPEGIAVHPDGTTVYVTNNFGRSVSVIDTTTNFVVTNVIVGAFPRGVAVSQDGNYIYVANQEDNTLSIINTVTFQQIKVKVGIKPNGVAVDPNGRYIYVVNQKSENVSWVGTYSYTAIYDWPAKKSPMAMGQFIVPPENIFTNSKVISTPYYYQSWGNYPLINIFDKKYIPLLSNGDPIWKNHVDKIAMLLNDSRGPYTLNVGKKAKELDLGQGYSLIAKAVDVDSKKVWLEFDKDGHYVDDAFISTDTGDHTWTCKLDNLQGVENVPVLKVHVNKINNYSTNGTQINTVNIDGLWLIDYANTRTLNIDDSFGNTPFIKYTLTKIINGNPFYYDSNQPFCGELVFKRSSFMITLSDQNKTKVK